MTRDQQRRGAFEERLLDELRSLVVAQPSTEPTRRPGWRSWIWSSSRRRLALVGAAASVVAVGAAAGIPFVVGGAEPAYAVSRNDDGTVTVEISSLRDAAGLEAKLRQAGIPAVVQYLPPGKSCKHPWPHSSAAAGEPTAGGDHAGTKGGVEHTSDGHVRFTISNDLGADETLVIMTQVGPTDSSVVDDPTSIAIALVRGQVGECEIVDAPPGSGPLGLPAEGGKLQG